MTRKELQEKIQELRKEVEQIYFKASEQRALFLDKNRATIDEKKQQIEELANQLKTMKKPDLELPEEIKTWFRKYRTGVDFGYGGLKIIYLSPKQKYVIMTNKGGTGGTGTAMGTGGYYYVKTSHWVTKVGETYFTQQYLRELGLIEGRLSKEKRQEMINHILELEKGEVDGTK